MADERGEAWPKIHRHRQSPLRRAAARSPHPRAPAFYVNSGAMNRVLEDTDDGLHELILRSLRDRQALWMLVLATYRVELTMLLDRADKSGFDQSKMDTLIDIASRIAHVAAEAEMSSIRADALTLRNYATNEQSGESSERRVLLAGLKLIERILDTERARRDAGSTGSPMTLN